MDSESATDAWMTVTHARVRASQGDVEEARRILDAIVAARPDDREARDLLVTIAGAPSAACSDVAAPALEEPVSACARDLASVFRAALVTARSPREAARARLQRFASRLAEHNREKRRDLR